MTTNDFLRKLEPLVPQRVSRWRRLLDVGDQSTRAIVKRQIAAETHRLLKKPRALLLSLPPKKKAGGAIHLGTIRYEKPKWPVGLKRHELLQNLAIFGRSGAGKTNVSFHLLLELERLGTPFVFLDWKRTARHLLPHLQKPVRVFTPGRTLAPFSFNPFIPPPGLEPQVHANHVLDVLCSAFTLGDGSRSLLQKALLATYNEDTPPTADRLLTRIEAVPDKERMRAWKITAIRALETIALMTPDGNDVTQDTMVVNLLQRSTIIELDGLSPSNKRFLVPLLALWIYHSKLTSPDREKLSLVRKSSPRPALPT